MRAEAGCVGEEDVVGEASRDMQVTVKINIAKLVEGHKEF
jgi:hypothetical protein